MLVKRDASVSDQHNEDLWLRKSVLQVQREHHWVEIGNKHTVESTITGSNQANGSSNIDFGKNFLKHILFWWRKNGQSFKFLGTWIVEVFAHHPIEHNRHHFVAWIVGRLFA